MSLSPNTNGYQGDEIDLFNIIQILWGKRYQVLSIFFLSISIMILLLLIQPKIYKAEALIAPSEDAQGGGVSKMASQLGGLASLANINLGPSSADRKLDVAMEVMKSRDFFYMFVQKYSILPNLMAAKNWDRESNAVIYDSDAYDFESKTWVRAVKPPQSQEPSLWEAYEQFKEIFNLYKDKQTGFIKVSIEHVSPGVAKEWVDLLIKEVNLYMKNKDVDEATKSISFLNDQLAKTPLAEMRTVFYQLIEEQMKTIMLAEVRDEYIFTTIDPAVVAEESIKPKKILFLIVGIIVGCALSFIYVFYAYFFE